VYSGGAANTLYELFDTDSRQVVVDHRTFINEPDHICVRMAAAQGKRPHRVQSGAKIVLRLCSNIERLDPLIDIGPSRDGSR